MAKNPSGRTTLKTLRKKYGPRFAKRYRSDMKLSTLLERTRNETFQQYMKKHKKR